MRLLKLWAKVAEFVTNAMFGTNLAACPHEHRTLYGVTWRK